MYKDESFSLGENFHQVACKIFPDDLFDESDDGHWFVPYIVNLSFACELYLKSLLSDGESIVRGHCLSELFNSLDDRIKRLVLESPQFKGSEDFDIKMGEANNLFSDWRYCFEHKKPLLFDFVFIENLAIVLHAVAEKEVTPHDQL